MYQHYALLAFQIILQIWSNANVGGDAHFLYMYIKLSLTLLVKKFLIVSASPIEAAP